TGAFNHSATSPGLGQIVYGLAGKGQTTTRGGVGLRRGPGRSIEGMKGSIPWTVSRPPRRKSGRNRNSRRRTGRTAGSRSGIVGRDWTAGRRRGRRPLMTGRNGEYRRGTAGRRPGWSVGAGRGFAGRTTAGRRRRGR